MKFKKGDRVELSKLGAERLSSKAKRVRLGTVVGFGRAWSDCVGVKWDNLKTVNSIHKDFLVKCVSGEQLEEGARDAGTMEPGR